MSTIVYYKNKKNGVTYAYESVSYWDNEKQQGRSKRKCIGHVDPDSGEILPNRPKKARETVTATASDAIPSIAPSHSYYGATYLLDSIGEKLGIAEDLKSCFPDDYKQILSIAYYLILEDKNPLFRFEKWGSIHKHPYGADIPSQRSSDLFMSITDEAQRGFFRRQGKRRIEKEYWAYDTTTISSYSDMLRQIQYGKNKEDDKLPQLNLALVFGEKSGLPFYYRKLAGNIPDVKTVKNLLAELEVLGFSKVKLVMDRGFYSESNINGMYQEHLKFLAGVKTSLSFVRRELDTVYEDIRLFTNFNETHGVYAYRVASEWRYTQNRPYKGDTINSSKRIYIHLYYNIDKAAEDEKNMDLLLAKLRDELLSGHRVEAHEKQYNQYFDVHTTPKRGTQVCAKMEAIKKAKRYYGYFALVTNEAMDTITALELYKAKDIVEKAFGNLKERLNMRRLLVSSEKSLSGKLFVEFIALIYLSYINKQMREQGLYKKYTLQGVLDKLDVIECFESPGKDLRIGEILEKQKELYLKLGIQPPA